jgi:hypothetical protein
MLKVLLMMPLLATLLVPAIAARDKKPQRGFRAMLLWILGIDIVYASFLYFVYLNVA